MKILVISNLYPPYMIGGYEVACQDFCEGLADLGHQMEVLTSKYELKKDEYQNESGKIDQKDRLPQIQRLMDFNDPDKLKNQFVKKWIGIKSVYFDLSNFLVTFSEILRFKPDVVYIWNLAFVSISPILATRLLAKKFIFHLEDYWLGAALRFNQPQNQGAMEELIKKVLSRLIRQKIVESPFIAVSEHIRQYYLKQGMQGQGTVIYNSLGESLFVGSHRPETRDHKTILYVGRVIEDKGVHLIIEAMGLLKEQGYNDLKLDIIGTGEGEYIKRLNAMILEGGLSRQVNFLGQKNHKETLALYSLYSIIIVPSIWDEPFGLVAIEAMSGGCVPIVSSSGALPEIVESGINGLVFQKGDIKDLADKIRNLLEHKLFIEELSHAAFSVARQKFSLEEKVKEAEAFLAAVTQGLRGLGETRSVQAD